MKGLQIFTHSLRQVTGNLEGAIRISAVPYLVQFAAGLIVTRPWNATAQMEAMVQLGMGHGPSVLLALVNLVIALVTSIWMAVAWHRFVLKNEAPTGFIPAFRGDQILAYFLRSLGIAVICIILAIPLGMIAGFIAYPFMGPYGPNILTIILIMLITYFPLVLISYRLSASLPAVAVDEAGSFTAGWDATQGATGDLAVLALVSVAVFVGGSLLGLYVFGAIGILSIAWTFVFHWLVMMIGVSILTTLYGHYIEKRALV